MYTGYLGSTLNNQKNHWRGTLGGNRYNLTLDKSLEMMKWVEAEPRSGGSMRRVRKVKSLAERKTPYFIWTTTWTTTRVRHACAKVEGSYLEWKARLLLQPVMNMYTWRNIVCINNGWEVTGLEARFGHLPRLPALNKAPSYNHLVVMWLLR